MAKTEQIGGFTELAERRRARAGRRLLGAFQNQNPKSGNVVGESVIY